MTEAKPAAAAVLHLRPGQHLASQIATRAGGAIEVGTIKRDLGRYYALLADELRRVDLTEHEAMLICDVMNGTLSDQASYRYGLMASVEDGIKFDRADEKWEVDAAVIIAKVRALTPAQAMAVVDAAERFWNDCNAPDQIRAVGLVHD